MARVVKSPDVRRDELMDVAMRLFGERGYHDTSVQAVTDATGVAKGLFYHYFESKDDLLDQLATREAVAVFADVEEAIRECDASPIGRLAVVLSRLTRWEYVDARGLTGAIVHALYRDGNGLLRVGFYRHYDALFAPLVRGLVEDAVGAGEADVTDPEATTEVLLAMWFGLRDRTMPLVLEARERPENLAVVARIIEALERSAERTLGARPDSLHVHDHATIEADLLALLDAEPPKGM